MTRPHETPQSVIRSSTSSNKRCVTNRASTGHRGASARLGSPRSEPVRRSGSVQAAVTAIPQKGKAEDESPIGSIRPLEGQQENGDKEPSLTAGPLLPHGSGLFSGPGATMTIADEADLPRWQYVCAAPESKYIASPAERGALAQLLWCQREPTSVRVTPEMSRTHSRSSLARPRRR
jgi:hypothetical protein